MVSCALCGFQYEPGGESCRSRGCPVSASGCRLEHCPRCGYATPDAARGLAGWLRRALSQETPVPETVAPLSEARVGRDLFVDRIEASAGIAAQLTLLGLTDGVRLTLQQRFPAFVVAVDGSEVALERAVAETIWVRQEGGRT
jgi:Fe2+ transport system protein FeoA